MSDAVITVENLGKKYRIKHQAERQRYKALRDVLADKSKGVARRLWSAMRAPGSSLSAPCSTAPAVEDFWALKDVSFDVKQGEVVGIIGRNGAGKSTLLKILSRITEPTTGRIHLRGRVASLLEVGTGFHPELTGRENIFLNGAILGMTREEIKRKFDEIVAFSEVEKFLDTPVKRYSSGMYVRLAFAVAAHLEPEILIVDEVLAVGDAEFQKKCLGKMGEVAKAGRTVLVVSHNFGLIRALCTSALALNGGTLIWQGEVDESIDSLPRTACSTRLPTYRFDGPLQRNILFQQLRINGQDPHETEVVTSPHDPLEVEVEYEVINQFEGRLTVALFAEGSRVLSAFDRPNHEEFAPGRWVSRFKWPPRLLRPHLYAVSLGAYSGSKHGPHVWGQDVALFQVGAEWNEEFEERSLGLVNFPPTAERNRLT